MPRAGQICRRARAIAGLFGGGCQRLYSRTCRRPPALTRPSPLAPFGVSRPRLPRLRAGFFRPLPESPAYALSIRQFGDMKSFLPRTPGRTRGRLPKIGKALECASRPKQGQQSIKSSGAGRNPATAIRTAAPLRGCRHGSADDDRGCDCAEVHPAETAGIGEQDARDGDNGRRSAIAPAIVRDRRLMRGFGRHLRKIRAGRKPTGGPSG